MELRDYQIAATEAVFDYFATKEGAPLVVLPTGSGKSICVADLIRRVLIDVPHEHCLVLSHRQEILAQNAAKVQTLLPHISLGVYSAGLGQKRLRQVTVAGVQSLARVRQLPPFQLVIVDECHLVAPDGETTYRRVIDRLVQAQPGVRIVGYSATPFRLGSGYLHEGDDRLFTDIGFEVPVRELIDAGWLVPLVTKHTATQADLSGVHIRGGDYVAGEAERAVDTDDLVRAACEEMIRYGEERRSWLVFAAGIKHARHVHEELTARGIRAQCLFGDTPTGVRERMTREFKEQRLRAIVSVDCLTTGFDAPCVDMIAMLRPTKSSGLWVQACGRGTRLSPETRKKDCLVLDFCNTVSKCGTIDDPIIRRKRKKGEAEADREAPVKVCPECSSCLHVSARECPDCGHQFPEPELKHAPVASNAPVMRSNELEFYPVERVSYRRHAKMKVDDYGDEVESITFRVDYQAAGIGPRASEWISFGHEKEWARAKAARWWRERARLSFEESPRTVDEALERQGQLKPVAGVYVRREGKFYRPVRVLFQEEGLTRIEEPSEQLSPLEELGI